MSKENSQAREFAESLSALMDNESDELELRRLLKELPGHPEIAQTWSRYHLARSVLHKEEVRPVSAAATLSIMAAIAQEQPYAGAGSAAKSSVRGAWAQTIGRVAIAASVAIAGFVGLQSALNQGIPETSIADQQSPQERVQAVEPSEVALGTGFDADAQQRLNDYIRGVSIQYREDGTAIPAFNILQDSQLIRQVNQIEK